MFDYIINNYPLLITLFIEHITLVGISVLIGLVLSFIISFIIYNISFLHEPFMALLRIIYTIPSLAFFAILIPFSGIGMKSAIIVLSAYTLFFLVNNFLNGMFGIDQDVLDASQAVGYSPLQIYFKILIPLAMPSIITGIRLALISTIGITCIAYSIGAGGIGSLLFEGMRQLSYKKILTGSLLVIILNIIVNSIMLRLERYVLKQVHI